MSANLPVPVLVGEVLNPPTPSALPIPTQADSDRDLVALWVARSASPGTRRKYRAQAARFLAFVAKPLALVRLGDVQAYLATLEGQAPATRANATAALKSLFSFAQETGYLRFNLGKVLKAPPVKNMLASRADHARDGHAAPDRPGVEPRHPDPAVWGRTAHLGAVRVVLARLGRTPG